jgi:hypothetical protein
MFGAPLLGYKPVLTVKLNTLSTFFLFCFVNMFWGCGIFHFEGLELGEKKGDICMVRMCKKRMFSTKLTSIILLFLKRTCFAGYLRSCQQLDYIMLYCRTNLKKTYKEAVVTWSRIYTDICLGTLRIITKASDTITGVSAEGFETTTSWTEIYSVIAT